VVSRSLILALPGVVKSPRRNTILIQFSVFKVLKYLFIMKIILSSKLNNGNKEPQ